MLAVDHRWKVHPAAAAKRSDFTAHTVGSLDPSAVIEDPALSLYCIDAVERTGIFVRTPPHVNLLQAPFLYQTQFAEATEIISVPFQELHELAARVRFSSEGLVLVQSTARCGSTLVCQALAAGDDVVALSEPDVYFQVQQLRDKGDPEAEELLATCTAMLFAPRAARTSVIKFRSQNIELAEPMLRCFPGAKTVFLYRRAEPWARSATRAFAVFGPEFLGLWDVIYDILPRVRSALDGAVLRPFSSPEELLSWIWATAMVRAMIMQREGIAMFVARYEELNDRPIEVLTALRDYCDVRVSADPLAAVLARDSQEGTEHSRARELVPGCELTNERLTSFMRCLEKFAPSLDPDVVLPGTFGT